MVNSARSMQEARTGTSQTRAKHPIFNGEYEIIRSLGEGNTSKVYLARNIEDGNCAALKILKEEFLRRDEESILSVHNEITILKNLNQIGIVQLYGYGDMGHVLKPSGRNIHNLVYLMMEYAPGGLLFDLCQTMGAMGEFTGRFLFTQLLDSLDYLHTKRVVHRDLKLENILLDDQFNVKLADFGFACYKNIDALTSYRGTMTYMAPEIKEGKTYKGTQVDLFSLGVILFIIVQGIFPFKEARKEEYFYKLLIDQRIETYWTKVNGQGLSENFKDLILKLFSYEPNNRPTIEEIRAHPWLTQAEGYDAERTRQQLQTEHARRKAQKLNNSARVSSNPQGAASPTQQNVATNKSHHSRNQTFTMSTNTHGLNSDRTSRQNSLTKPNIK